MEDPPTTPEVSIAAAQRTPSPPPGPPPIIVMLHRGLPAEAIERHLGWVNSVQKLRPNSETFVGVTQVETVIDATVYFGFFDPEVVEMIRQAEEACFLR
jgi:hypothetical protein